MVLFFLSFWATVCSSSRCLAHALVGSACVPFKYCLRMLSPSPANRFGREGLGRDASTMGHSYDGECVMYECTCKQASCLHGLLSTAFWTTHPSGLSLGHALGAPERPEANVSERHKKMCMARRQRIIRSGNAHGKSQQFTILLTSKKWRLQSGCNHSTAYVDQWKG